MSQFPKARCDVFEAMASRRAVRAFLPTPVERKVVEHILELAARAPSGTNIQPWRVWALSGTPLKGLSAKLMAAHDADEPGHAEEYPYYPSNWVDPYLSRRRKLGRDLYSLLGIGKGDETRMKHQFGRNYVFFDAPVGLFITIDKAMNTGSWFDLGTFLQSILLAARGFGLHSCPQQSFSKYHKIIKPALGIPDDQIIACGVALGYEDTSAPENQLATEREPVESFTTFLWA
ncbi:MAG TPA: nitroreductase [Candidatus Sulfotelmatobacter sp.]|nr:nitroreductase [Candidatus Sulfotelmatobacter sp.]